MLSGSVLVESKSARCSQLEPLSHERAQEILAKVKALYFALWRGTGMATTEQVAEFYDVATEVVHQVVKRHRDEFNVDGLETIRGKALKDAPDSLSVPPTASQLTLWTPRACLRLGMLLRDSDVAKAIRSTLLDAVELIPAQERRIRELELELAIAQAQGETAKAQERLLAVTQAIALLHGREMVALILGKPEAMVTHAERVETLVPVDSQGRAIAQYDGVGITYLAKRYGFGKKTQACREWLKTIGVRDEQWQQEPSLVSTHKLPRELLIWIDQQYATRQGERQRLLGE